MQTVAHSNDIILVIALYQIITGVIHKKYTLYSHTSNFSFQVRNVLCMFSRLKFYFTSVPSCIICRYCGNMSCGNVFKISVMFYYQCPTFQVPHFDSQDANIGGQFINGQYI